jgi:hypothetical protein
MSTNLIRILIAGALFVHGVGHTLGLFMPSHSWLMPNVSKSVMGTVSRLLWVLVTVGFIISCLGFIDVLVPADWWRPFAVVFAFISLLGLGLFWGTWPIFNTIGALVMNTIVLITQLWLHWPATSMFGN